MGIDHSATILTMGVAAVSGAAVVLAADSGFLLDLIATVSTWLPLPAVTGDGLAGLVGTGYRRGISPTVGKGVLK